MDSDLFTELESSAGRLNELSDSIDRSINQKIREVEERLDSMRIGIEALLEEPLSKTPVEKTDGLSIYRLGYRKDPDVMAERWCLFIKHSLGQRGVPDYETSDFEEPVEIYPLLQASRELRILAIRHLPELLKTLQTEVDRRVQAIQELAQGAKVAIGI
jgi:hypothetical protein